MKEEKTIKLIEHTLKRYGLIEPDFDIHLIKRQLFKLGFRFKLNVDRIDVYNMFTVCIIDNIEIRVREDKYEKCGFDSNEEGCYSFYNIEDFVNYIKNKL